MKRQHIVDHSVGPRWVKHGSLSLACLSEQSPVPIYYTVYRDGTLVLPDAVLARMGSGSGSGSGSCPASIHLLPMTHFNF